MLGKRGALKIFVPVLVLAIICGVCINAHAQKATGVWQVKIKDISTRHMESHGFFAFKLDWKWEMRASKEFTNRKKTCLCLNSSGNDEKDPYAKPVECREPTEEENSCLAIINTKKSGAANYSIGPIGNMRYYFEEGSTAKLKDILKNEEHEYRVEVISGNDYSAEVGEFYIDGIPVNEYLKKVH